MKIYFEKKYEGIYEAYNFLLKEAIELNYLKYFTVIKFQMFKNVKLWV